MDPKATATATAMATCGPPLPAGLWEPSLGWGSLGWVVPSLEWHLVNAGCVQALGPQGCRREPPHPQHPARCWAHSRCTGGAV